VNVTLLYTLIGVAIAISSSLLIGYVFYRRLIRISSKEKLRERERLEYERRRLELELKMRYEESLLQLQEGRHLKIQKLAETIGQNVLTAKRMTEIIEEKKRKFQEIPSITFHFANRDQIKSFYDEYFKEPTIESFVSEVVGEITGEMKGSIPQILESKIGGKDISKWVSTIKIPDISLSGMFLRYQRETIKKDQVVLGIEEVDIELTELQEFEDNVENLEKRFGLKLDEELLNAHRVHLKEKAAKRTLTKLEQASGWLLVEGRFKILREGEYYRCVYRHPVSDYLVNQTDSVTISILIPANSLESHIAGNYARSVDKVIPLRVYGQLWQPLNTKDGIWEVQLTPLAVY
jgi:hypothetical protein